MKIRGATAKIVREVENDGRGEYCMEREAGGGRSADPGEARPPSTLIHTAKKVEKVVAELFLQS